MSKCLSLCGLTCLFLVGAMGVVGVVLSCNLPGLKIPLSWFTTGPPPSPSFSNIPTVEKLQPLAELVSLRVQIVDILTVEQTGWFSFQGAWLIHGDALWTTDLQQAHIEVVPQSSGTPTVQIRLPLPQVTWARLDHAKTQTYDLRSTAWIPFRSVPHQIQDEAQRRGQELVARLAHQDQYRRQAQCQAEATLQRFYANSGVIAQIVWLTEASQPAGEAPE